MIIPKWLVVLIAIYIPYHAIANYCRFKASVGFETYNCGCEPK